MVLFTAVGNPEGGADDSGESPSGKRVGEIRLSKYREANQIIHDMICYMNDFGYYSIDGGYGILSQIKDI